jgi:hypothetical protein
LDIAKLKRNRGRLSGFIMGLIASIYGGLFALIIGTSILAGHQDIFFLQYDSSVATAVAILLFLTVAASIVGAGLIRAKRIVGGLIIIGASIPLFVIAVIDSAAFSILAFTSLVCIAAGILAFIPLPDSYFQKLVFRQQYHRHMEAFITQQQQIAQQEDTAISVAPIDSSAQFPEPNYPVNTEKQEDKTQW